MCVFWTRKVDKWLQISKCGIQFWTSDRTGLIIWGKKSLFFEFLWPKTMHKQLLHNYKKTSKSSRKRLFLALHIFKWRPNFGPKKVQKKAFFAPNDQTGPVRGPKLDPTFWYLKSTMNLLSSKYTQKLTINSQQLLNSSKTTFDQKAPRLVQKVQKYNFQNGPL